MRNTKQRELILSVINNSYDHLTAEEIYLMCKGRINNISLGTVYRNLNTLVSLGLIKRIKMPNKIDRYDHLNTSHAHFICRKCNKVIDLDESNIIFNKNIGKNIVLDYEVNYNGICEDCQEEE